MSIKLRANYTIEREPVCYELDIFYTYHPYQPMRGPSYACGGEPAEPESVEIDRIECDQVDGPFELDETATCREFRQVRTEGVLDWLLCEAQDEMNARADDAADYRYERLREDRQ